MSFNTSIKETSLCLALENSHKAKRKLRIAWDLEDNLFNFLDLEKAHPVFFLACALRKRPDGMMGEIKRVISPHEEGTACFHLPSVGIYTIRPFLVWPKRSDSVGGNFAKRLVTPDLFTKTYKCGIFDCGGEIDNFHRLASSQNDSGHSFHRMRESVIGPDYFLYDFNISKEVKVVR